ncbi:MAG: hypothetical protein HQ490_04325 [Lutibacter sp.]|nr:hypothetical protein [Lutibacter sp.]
MSSFKPKNSNKDNKIRLNKLDKERADAYTFAMFRILRKDDSCLNRFLRFFKLKTQQKI